MAESVSKDIAVMEELISKLQVGYEQFFSGAVRHEPQDLIQQVESIIRIYNRGQIQNPVLRFRFNNLVARYNSFKNVWERRKRKMEGAAPSHAYGLKSDEVADESYTSIITEGHLKKEQVTEIFNHYVELRRKHNEPVDNMRIENFKAVLNEYIAKIKKKQKCKSVIIKIDVHKNRCRIFAKSFK